MRVPLILLSAGALLVQLPVTPVSADPKVNDFVLVNTDTKEEYPTLVDNQIIDLSDYGHKLTIKLKTSGYTCRNGRDNKDLMVLDLDEGHQIRIEETCPFRTFYVAGEDETTGQPNPSNTLVKLGTHTILACPIVGSDMSNVSRKMNSNNASTSGCKKITVYVVDGPNAGAGDAFYGDVARGSGGGGGGGGTSDSNNIINDIPEIKGNMWGVLNSPTVTANADGTTTYRVNDKLVLAFTGPPASEAGMTEPNPYRQPSVFADYLFNVEVSKGSTKFVVPGYYAGNGNVVNDGTASGHMWQAIIRVPEKGTWTWKATFLQGVNSATGGFGNPGKFFDGNEGTFEVEDVNEFATSKGKGRLVADGTYWKYENGEIFLPVGPGSPVNLLQCEDFDNTVNGNSYDAHAADYDNIDKSLFTYANGKGKNMLGALQYLASKGMNIISVTALTNGVSPFRGNSESHLQYDLSKLGQWGALFDAAETLGLAIRFKLADADHSDDVLDEDNSSGGNLSDLHKLYYREMIARFGHHLHLIWDLGEDLTAPQLEKRADYFRDIDAYQAPLVARSGDDNVQNIVNTFTNVVDGIELHTGDITNVNADTIALTSGGDLVVTSDQQGHNGIQTDDHDDIRQVVLWASFMGGGSGVQYHLYDDLQDFRSREDLWDYSKYALDFFTTHVDVTQLNPANDLVNEPNLCMTDESSDTIVVYKKAGVDAILASVTGTYSMKWYNPRTGELQDKDPVESGSDVSLGAPLADDCAILLKK